MADLGITGLKTEVDVQIYTNHAQAITGAIMNDTLIDTIDTLKNGGNLDEKSVDTAQLADGAVEALQINTGAVTEAKIASGAVTESKIGAKAVTSEKLADDVIEQVRSQATNKVPSSKLFDDTLESIRSNGMEETVPLDMCGSLIHPTMNLDFFYDQKTPHINLIGVGDCTFSKKNPYITAQPGFKTRYIAIESGKTYKLTASNTTREMFNLGLCDVIPSVNVE